MLAPSRVAADRTDLWSSVCGWRGWVLLALWVAVPSCVGGPAPNEAGDIQTSLTPPPAPAHTVP